MKVAMYEGIENIKIREMKLNELNEDDILIKVKVAGICATDVKTYLRGHPAFKPPVVLGHEYSGIVQEVGSKVSVCKKGDRVTVAPYIECGECIYCKKNDRDLCINKLYSTAGAFAEYVVINQKFAEKAMLILDKRISYRVASLTEPLACCINTINQCSVKKGDNVLIIGAGAMGILNGFISKIRGAENVIISDINSMRLNIAEEFGLIPVNVEKENLNELVNKITNNIKCDVVIVAVGNVKVVEDGFQYVRKGGKVHMFGGDTMDSIISVPSHHIHYSKISLLGSSGFSSVNFKEAMDVIGDYDELLKNIITDSYSLENIEIGINNVAEGKGLRTIIEFE